MMKSKKGFTLVELAIVIVVIGILAAIAIPRFLTMQEAAGKAALDANFDGLRTAIVAVKARMGRFPTTAELDRGYVRIDGDNKAFFSSPVERYSDETYSNYLVNRSAPSGVTRVGSGRCRSGAALYLLNKYPNPDVYGVVCYDQAKGTLKKTW